MYGTLASPRLRCWAAFSQAFRAGSVDTVAGLLAGDPGAVSLTLETLCRDG